MHELAMTDETTTHGGPDASLRQALISKMSTSFQARRCVSQMC
jgi:hypothetical protein